ncbi:DUF4255 domain-containing protein [Streptomyces sp. NPDC057743]|uniref:DUF4255 domain-containing protein n=1 Tax=Streptomyces sp. NPDC057743 TaxID=3346236 RepID=UPI0036AF3DD9
MSDPRSVAAATEGLRAVLQDAVSRAVPGAVVTVGAPHEAAVEGAAAELNVFLYRTTVDGAWRNSDPVGARPGETRCPPLPLVLHYLLICRAPADAGATVPQLLLGQAMSALHDRPVLSPDVLREAAGFSDLYRQQEPVRITPAALSTEAMARLWTALHIGDRLAVAYEARVVLIDSAVPGRAPLPVLRRGERDRGPEVTASTAVTWPALHSVSPPVAAPGTELELVCRGLDAATVSVSLTHAVLGGPVVLPARVISAGTVRAVLGEDHGAGRWSVVVSLQAADGSRRTTGTRWVDVAPRITGRLPLTATRDSGGAVDLAVECTPRVHPGQRVELLVGELPVPAEPFTEPTGRLRFRVARGVPGRYAVRLRVDGVDSPLVDARTEQFEADTAVVIT